MLNLSTLFDSEVDFWAPLECLGAFFAILYFASSVDYGMTHIKMDWKQNEMEKVLIYFISRLQDHIYIIWLREAEIENLILTITQLNQRIRNTNNKTRSLHDNISHLRETHKAKLLAKDNEIRRLREDRAREVADLKDKTASEIDSLKEENGELKTIVHENAVERYDDQISFAREKAELEKRIAGLKQRIPYLDLHEELLRLRDERSALLKEKKISDCEIKYEDHLEAENGELPRLLTD